MHPTYSGWSDNLSILSFWSSHCQLRSGSNGSVNIDASRGRRVDGAATRPTTLGILMAVRYLHSSSLTALTLVQAPAQTSPFRSASAPFSSCPPLSGRHNSPLSCMSHGTGSSRHILCPSSCHWDGLGIFGGINDKLYAPGMETIEACRCVAEASAQAITLAASRSAVWGPAAMSSSPSCIVVH